MIHMMRYCGAAVVACLLPYAYGQTAKPVRMEIVLEKEDHGKVQVMEPGHVFESGDRLRFRFTPSFGGSLFVMDKGTSGAFTLLFPKEDSGTNDRIEPGKPYVLPSAEKGWFRVSGPAGHDVVYFVVTSGKTGAGAVTSMRVPHVPGSEQGTAESPATDFRKPDAPQPGGTPPGMTPRCNDALFQARGECIDLSAGPKAAGDSLPPGLGGAKARELYFIRKEKTSVVSSPQPLDGPAVYEFHIAHK